MSEVFEWALIRVMPRVDRGEAINAGVIVYSKSFRYLKTRIELDERRLRALDPDADLTAVRAALTALELACTTGPLAELTLGERFRPGRPHPRRRHRRPAGRPHPPLRLPRRHLAT
jgi:hypothetical protein